MSNTTLVLADGTTIRLEDGASLADMRVQYPDRVAMATDWEKLTAANLKTVQIMTDDTETGHYAGLMLVSETSIVAPDGTVTTSWRLRQKTELELLWEEVEALKAGQDVQDGAIMDTAMAIDTLMQGGGQ